MLNDFLCPGTIYLACGYTDLRKGIDGLALLIEQQFQMAQEKGGGGANYAATIPLSYARIADRTRHF